MAIITELCRSKLWVFARWILLRWLGLMWWLYLLLAKTWYEFCKDLKLQMQTINFLLYCSYINAVEQTNSRNVFCFLFFFWEMDWCWEWKFAFVHFSIWRLLLWVWSHCVCVFFNHLKDSWGVIFQNKAFKAYKGIEDFSSYIFSYWVFWDETR